MTINDVYYLLRRLIKRGHLQIVSDGLITTKDRKTDYVYGSATPFKKEVICPTGDWTPFLPTPERQSGRTVETMSCTVFAFLNCIETIIFAKYGIRVNYSDRYLSKCAGTTTAGNDMNKVIDTARKIAGNVLEEVWPSKLDEMTWASYFSEIPKAVMVKGHLWINEYAIGSDIVPQNRTLMKDALTSSPLYLSGYAWYKENGLYRSYGKANHAFMGYKLDGAFDTYEPFQKQLAPDYKFGSVKALYVNKLTPQNIEINNFLVKGYKYIMRVENRGEIYKIVDGVLQQIPIEDLISSLKIDGTKGTDFNAVISQVVKAMFTSKLLAPISEDNFNKMI